MSNDEMAVSLLIHDGQWALRFSNGRTASAPVTSSAALLTARLVDGDVVTVSTKVKRDDCSHPEESHKVVSEVVRYVGIRNDANGAHDYEEVRQIIACHNCGSFIQQRDIKRDGTT